MKDLATLHECLSEATFEEILLRSTKDYQIEGRPKRRPQVMQSFILDPDLKIVLDKICRANGATASSFLRECCRRLAEEYGADLKE